VRRVAWRRASQEIFALFDKCLFLSQGEVIYAGPTREPLARAFGGAGFEIPKHHNPSDFCMYTMQMQPLEQLRYAHRRGGGGGEEGKGRHDADGAARAAAVRRRELRRARRLV
jgi:ABC-type multidrug transport system ATPase subunit